MSFHDVPTEEGACDRCGGICCVYDFMGDYICCQECADECIRQDEKEEKEKIEISIEVSSHPWRCIDEDGKRCQVLWMRKLGTILFCPLFCEQDEPLNECDGCLEKHEKCKMLCERAKGNRHV